MKKSTPPAPVLLANLGPSSDDIRYVTHFTAPDLFFLLLLPHHPPTLFVPTLEVARAKKACPTATIFTPERLHAALHLPCTKNAPSPPSLLPRFLLHRKITRLAIPPDFPCAIAANLRAAHITLSPAPSPLFPSRILKTPAEITAITAAQRTATAACRAAIQAIARATIHPTGRLLLDGRPLTSERLRAIIETVFLHHNCTAPQGTIAAAGRQAACPHEPGHGPIHAGHPIVLDLFPRNTTTGYWGDLTRTVVKGHATPPLRAIHRTVAAAQRLAFSLLRPGVPRQHVHRAVAAFFHAEGFPASFSPPDKARGFIHALGHGLGLSIHESPGLNEDPGRLRAGEVLSVEPGLYHPAFGGVRIEDIVLITPTGFRLLAPCTRRFLLP